MKTIRIETVDSWSRSKITVDIVISAIISITKADYEELVTPVLYVKHEPMGIISKKESYEKYTDATTRIVSQSCIRLSGAEYYVAKSLDEIKEMIRCA